MSGFLSAVRGWFSLKPDAPTDWLWFERHRLLCTAIPFPDLNWADSDGTSGRELCEDSRRLLYQFAESLALTAIDWYGTKKAQKRLISKLLRNVSYLFAVVGAALPLTKLLPDISHALFGSAFSNLSEVSAEIALVLLGVAGGLHLIDGLLGASTAWMRYTSTAMQIEQKLLNFRFDWNEALSGARLPAKRSDPSGPVPSRPLQQIGPGDPKEWLSAGWTLFELARDFCDDVVKSVGEETEKWAREFSDSVTQFEKHISRNAGRQPGDPR